jgi:hypothetical protein
MVPKRVVSHAIVMGESRRRARPQPLPFYPSDAIVARLEGPMKKTWVVGVSCLGWGPSGCGDDTAPPGTWSAALTVSHAMVGEMSSSSKVEANWTAPSQSVDHYELGAVGQRHGRWG